MGAYTTRVIEEDEYRRLLDTLRNGYEYAGIRHRPNEKMADILNVEANLGIRLSDVLRLTPASFGWDGESWVLDIREKKTSKKRHFVVPKPIKAYIDTLAVGKAENERIFRVSEDAVQLAVRNAAAYLGLHNVSTHSCRKMMAMKIYLASGKDLALTCDFLQHSSPAITQRYLNRSSQVMESAIEHSMFIA